MVISLDVYRCECGEDLEPHHNSTTKRNYWKCPKCGALYEIDPDGPKRYKLTNSVRYGNSSNE